MRHLDDRIEGAAHNSVSGPCGAGKDEGRGEQQDKKRLLELIPNQILAIADANHNDAALKIIFAADQNNARAIGHSGGPSRISALTLACEWRASEPAVAQAFVAVKNRTVRSENFEQAFLNLLPVGVVVIVLAHAYLSIVRHEE